MSDLAPRVRQVRCGRCAAEAPLVQQMLDTGTGSTLRYMRVRHLASYAIHLPCRSQLPEEPGRIDEHRGARLAADQVWRSMSTHARRQRCRGFRWVEGSVLGRALKFG